MTRSTGAFQISTEADSRRLFYGAFLVTLVVKVWLAFVVPITGDEALFYWWGVHPYWGYYDHPPMVGWMLALLLQFGDAPIVLRLSTVAATFCMALALIDLVQRLVPDSANKKWVVGSLYLLTPLSWFGVPVTNDTPLMVFIFLSIYFFLRAEARSGEGRATGISATLRPSVWFFATGIALGLAFLSKYLAVVAAFGFIVALFRPVRWGGHGPIYAAKAAAMIFISFLPFGVVNLVYNAYHCWNNIMFNLINRNEGASVGIENPFVYVVMLVYLFTPWLLWSMARAGRSARSNMLVLCLAVVPFVFFLVVSLVKTIGLHWVVGFMPMVFVLAAVQLSYSVLRSCLKWTAFFSVAHLVVFAAVFAWPQHWMGYKAGAKAMGFVYDAPALAALAMQDAEADTKLMAEGYSPGSILGYHAKRYVPVFGMGSRYARQDDYQVDFRAIDGKTVRVVLRRERPPADFEPYFQSVAIRPLVLNGRNYWVVEGSGFDFAAYREQVLKEVARRYYQIPGFLPVAACPFLEKYDL